ncbi:MAG: hypothetical protein A2Y60_07525 [Chloroflexi bacterium RBG_13_54_9]|nr:MAG: hypothetical protein A2Y60_07525 [Chloroflexi bacterium RBG_13_54_9]
MPEFWLDTNSFIESKKGPYGFDIVPGFWTFLEQKANEGIIASSSLVYDELKEVEDDLLKWAKQRENTGFFVEPDASVQATFIDIADHVNNRYPPHQASHFLDGADPWIIAHAKAHGGRVVTFEKSAPNAQKPKIPDVCDCDKFSVKTLNVYEMLRELGASFQ